jgi:riboflavin kinase / FMN adenylyltransferase
MIYHGFAPEVIRRAFPEPFVTLGIFDGMHLGHQKLFARLLSSAKEHGKDSLVITFANHPREILLDKAPSYVTGIEHRLRLMRNFGMDAALVLGFNRELIEMTPERFVEKVLIQELNFQGIVLGYDGRFGKGGKGNVETVKEVCRRLGRKLLVAETVEPCMRDGHPVKSTRLREAILSGDLLTAERLLNRRVSIWGTVVRGEGRGQEIGYPTANLNMHHEVCPPVGVYKCIAQLGAKSLPRPALVNIGYRPTFYPGGSPLAIEVHLLNYAGDLYGQEIEVLFLKKIRDEIKFANAQELVARIKADIRDAFPEPDEPGNGK